MQDSCIDVIIILTFRLNKEGVVGWLASYGSDKGLLLGLVAQQRNLGFVESKLIDHFRE